MIAKTQKNIKYAWKIKSNKRKLLKIKRIHFFIKCCHPKILKVYRILLTVYSINNKRTINHEPSEMNNYFSNLATNLTNKENNESNLTTLHTLQHSKESSRWKLRPIAWFLFTKNVHQKVAPDPFLIYLNNPKQAMHTRNSFKSKVFWKTIIKKP